MTPIEWCARPGTKPESWNFTRGCRIKSPGCKNCYAMRQAHRFSGPGGKYEGLTVLTSAGPIWTGDGHFDPETLFEPLHWQTPRTVFVNSMSDLWHDAFTNEQIAAGFGVMSACDQHTFIILTKEAERMRSWFDWIARSEVTPEVLCRSFASARWAPGRPSEREFRAIGLGRHPRETRPWVWPLPNVWLLVSAEDQLHAERRLPHLLMTPAVVHGVSAEPLLGPIDFDDLAIGTRCAQCGEMPRASAFSASETCACCVEGPEPLVWSRLDWVIVGGESGNGARRCELEHVRSIVRQCARVEVPCFVKQLGACASDPQNGIAGARLKLSPLTESCVSRRLVDRKGSDPTEWPASERVRQYPGHFKAKQAGSHVEARS